MTRKIRRLGLAAAVAAASLPALAQTPDYSLTGNASLVSDYRFRGISQTNKKPAFQGGFDFAHSSGFYLGNWNSNVDSGFLAGANLEMDFYGGYKGSYDAFSYDIGGLYYYYPGSDPSLHTGELYVAGGWGPVSLKYSYAVTDFFGFKDSDGAYYVDATVNYPLGQGLTLVAHVGYQGGLKGDAKPIEIDGGSPKDSITDWKLGVTYDLAGWMLGASYIGTNRELAGSVAGRNISSDTLVVSVGKSF